MNINYELTFDDEEYENLNLEFNIEIQGIEVTFYPDDASSKSLEQWTNLYNAIKTGRQYNIKFDHNGKPIYIETYRNSLRFRSEGISVSFDYYNYRDKLLVMFESFIEDERIVEYYRSKS